MVDVAEKTLKEVGCDSLAGRAEQLHRSRRASYRRDPWEKVNAPVILIINKTDTVEKDKILEFIDTYRKLFQFAEIIPCSALRHQNTDDIIPSIFKYLPYGPQFYDEDTITDQPMRQIVAEIIREKALHALDAEIPHGIAVAIDRMKTRPGKNPIVDIDATNYL